MPIFSCPSCHFRWSGQLDFQGMVCPRCLDGTLKELPAPRPSRGPSLVRTLGLLAALGAVLAVRAALVFA